jgi:para-nitrobenzyl esterase
MNKIKFLLFNTLILQLCIQYSTAQCWNGRYEESIFSQIDIKKNITYSIAPNANNIPIKVLMDMYLPANDTLQNRPLIIFMHGGAYWTGTKDYQSQIELGKVFAKRGYAFCSATYRLEPNFFSLLSQEKMLKAVGRGVQDTKSLVRYFFNHARDSGNTFGIDTNQIFLCGGSAGAFNVMHAVYLDEEDSITTDWQNWLDDIGGVFDNYDFIDFGKRILGVVNINGALGDKSYLDNEHTDFLSVHNIFDFEIPFNRGKPYNIPTLMYVDGSNILHTKAIELGIYNPFYIIPDNGHTSFSSDFFGTVVQPFFDSTVWYMNQFFKYKMGCTETPTGISRNVVKSLNLFPNPTNQYLKIDGNFENVEFKIMSLDGKTQIQQTYNTKIDVGFLPQGNYILLLYDKQKQVEYLARFSKI